MGLGSRTAYLGGLKEYCMCPQELRSDGQCTEGEEGNRGGRKMQSAKNRLEMAVSPKPSGLLPQSRAASHGPQHTPRRANSRAQPLQNAARDNWQLLASCPQNKSRQWDWGPQCLEGSRRALFLMRQLPSFRSHQGAGRRWSDSRQTIWEQAEKYGGGAGRASTGALQCPPKAQTAKGASTGLGLIRTLTNPARPPYVHSRRVHGA